MGGIFKHLKNKVRISIYFIFASAFFGAVFAFSIPVQAAAAPVLFFSDLTSGPKTGWEGSATKGAAVTVWGKNFGSAGANSKITIGGVDIISTDSTYIAEWGTTLGNPKLDAATTLQSITFYLNSSMATGATTITVNVGGAASNILPFTARSLGSNHIYFVAANGNDANNGLYATQNSGSNGPWMHLYKSAPDTNANVIAGDTTYVRAGTYSTVQSGQRSALEGGPGGVTGTINAPIAWIGYPAERPNFTIPIITYHDPGFHGRNTQFDYGIVSRMKYTGPMSETVFWWGNGWRVTNIWSDMAKNPGNVNGGTISCTKCLDTFIMGNKWQNGGGDNWDHLVYPGGNFALSAGPINNMHLAYNEVDNYEGDTGTIHGKGGAVFNFRPGYGSFDGVYVYNNYMHDSDYGQFIYVEGENKANNFYLYNNLVTNINGHGDGSAVSAVFMDGGDGANNPKGTMYVYNNTFYETGGAYSVLTAWRGGNIVSKNNIIYESIGNKYLIDNKYGNEQVTSEKDCMYGNGAEPTGIQYTISNKISQNPLFQNIASENYALQLGSPCKDAGTSNVSSSVKYDLLGISRPQNGTYDIGAYEYVGSNPSVFEYVLNKNLYAIPTLSKPAKNASYVDPDFHTTVTRVTNAETEGGASKVAYQQYNRYSSTNSNNKYLLVHTGDWYKIYDIQNNFAFVKKAPHISTTPNYQQGGMEPEYRWDYTGNYPNRLYYRFGMKLYQVDVETGVNEIVHDFAFDFLTAEIIATDDEGDSSADSRYWAFMVLDDPSVLNLLYIIVYDKQTDKIVGQMNPTAVDPTYTGRPNFVDMSPSGNKIVLSGYWHQGTWGGDFDGVHAWNRDFTSPVKVGDESKHSGWAYDYSGNEAWVQETGGDYITATNVLTGAATQIMRQDGVGDWNTSKHFSRFYNANHKGWIMLSTYANNRDAWGDNQIFMMEIKPKDANNNPTGRIWRIAHTMNYYNGSDYLSEPHASLSLDGANLYFAARWYGNGETNSPVDTYHIALPANWSADLGGGVSSQSPADVNQDGKINIQDIQACVKVITGQITNPKADVNGDGMTNIKDIQQIVKAIIGG